ncbi:muconolactone Delta-isomerase family protein [Sphingomonas sp.]|uniref:muconolactone Delta-isomerase family protein n=1 Tax=Sphingomonas sp. TaxID=28214 RepID=UPI000DB6C2AE|nr:muconolactone Delta-isomerase family protein [Sphingomonas sp.]PZU09083.1 MAG: muconolactone delta-isomerase [Sphingomonas sp.]
MQFLVRTVSRLPADFPADRRSDLLARERERSRELSGAGKVLAHWQIPVAGDSLTLWEVSGAQELHELLMALPAAAWVQSSVTPLIDRRLRQHAKPAGS